MLSSLLGIGCGHQFSIDLDLCHIHTKLEGSAAAAVFDDNDEDDDHDKSSGTVGAVAAVYDALVRGASTAP